MNIPNEQQITERVGQLSVPSRLGVKNTLEPIKAVLAGLGNPEKKLAVMHVGGTSGKGSTSTFLANILADAGYTVGLFTKPHLSTVRERFTINGEPISPIEIMELLDRIGATLTEKPTWFELTTAMAYQYFFEQKVDLAVIEVGLGGSFDATNVIIPRVSVLTNVGLDHTDVLGSTVEEIASDKVGIIKPGRPVITGVTQPSVREIVQQKCTLVGAQPKVLDQDFGIKNIRYTRSGSQFDFWYGNRHYEHISTAALGEYQVTNAALAISAAMALEEDEYRIPENAFRLAVQRTQMAGRLEVFGNDPMIILDGAHSPPKMEAFTHSLIDLFPERKRIIGVLAISKGHDADATLSYLAPWLDAAVLTEFNVETDYGNKRAQDPADVAINLGKLNPKIALTKENDPYRALSLAKAMARQGDLVVVTGSIYLVGQLRSLLLPEYP